MFRLGPSRGRSLGTLGALTAAGFAFVFAVVIGALFGYALDRWFGTSPWFFLIFFFMGVAAGILNVFRLSAAYLDAKPDGPAAPPRARLRQGSGGQARDADADDRERDRSDPAAH